MLGKERNQFRGRTIVGYSARVVNAGLLKNEGDVVLRCDIMQQAFKSIIHTPSVSDGTA